MKNNVNINCLEYVHHGSTFIKKNTKEIRQLQELLSVKFAKKKRIVLAEV